MTRTLSTVAATAAAFALAALLAGCSSAPTAKQKEYADAVSIADPQDYGDMPSAISPTPSATREPSFVPS